MNTEYSSLTEGSSSKGKGWLRTLAGATLVAGVIGAITLLTNKNNGSINGKSYTAISTSSKDYDYSSNKLISYLSDKTEISYISNECTFTNVNNEQSNYGLEHEQLLKDLLTQNENSLTHYEITTISKPLYTVEWIFGTKTNKDGTNQHFTIVLQIDPKDNNNIFEVYLFTSDDIEESAESMYHRLFSAFDFNKNGVLCITEFPSMMGAISGLGNIEMSNDILSFMTNTYNKHIKFEESEFVEYCMSDNNANKIKHFGELRHLVQNGIIDGYLAMNNDDNTNSNTCLYYDLSYNCINGKYYKSDEDDNALYTVSDSIFASVCCVGQE